MTEQNKILLTKEGADTLKVELTELITVKRPETINQVQDAGEQGELSENADYDSAKYEQWFFSISY